MAMPWLSSDMNRVDGGREVMDSFSFRLPRMTTRSWMVAVALVALALGTVSFVNEMNRRSADRAAIAWQHQEQTRAGLARRGVVLIRETPRTEFHARMLRKWLNG